MRKQSGIIVVCWSDRDGMSLVSGLDYVSICYYSTYITQPDTSHNPKFGGNGLVTYLRSRLAIELILYWRFIADATIDGCVFICIIYLHQLSEGKRNSTFRPDFEEGETFSSPFHEISDKHTQKTKQKRCFLSRKRLTSS